MAKKKISPKQPEPRWMKHAWWLIPLLAVLVYIPSFTGGFTLDDNHIVEDNPLIRSLSNISKIWSSHYWAGKIDATDTSLYRPLTLTSYALQYAMNGGNPIPYHIINILLHALVCFALVKIVHLLFKNNYLTVLSGLLFAIHPIHTEAVSGIVGRAELMSALFILTSCICYHHWRENGNIKWLIGLLISTAASITSKEHGFMIPLILALQESTYYFKAKKYQWNSKRLWIALGVSTMTCVVFWIIHSRIAGPPVPHEQWLVVKASDRVATSIRTTSEYLSLHLWPVKLSADYWTDEVPIVGFGNAGVLIALVLLLVLIGIGVWQRKKMISFSWGIAFFFLTLLPVSNLIFAAGFLKAERVLYIPSIGLIVALATLLVKLYSSQKGKAAAYILAAGLTAFFILRTWIRAGDWKSNLTLAEATLKTSPNSPRMNNMMGLEMEHQQKHEEALTYYERAVKANPNHAPALVNLATEYNFFKRSDEAIATLKKAIAIDPKMMMAYVNLMSVYRSLGDYDNNLAVANQALILFPGSAPVLWNAANAYQLKHEMPKANELRAKAVLIQPDIGGK
ncbi:MAG: tetratricopeptide repeat protein [Saprospiraceae bacterium]